MLTCAGDNCPVKEPMPDMTPVMIGPVPTLAALNCVNSTPVPMVFEGAWTRINPPDRYCWSELMVQLPTARLARKLSVFKNFFPRPKGSS